MRILKLALVLLILLSLSLLCFGCVYSFTYGEYTDENGVVYREMFLSYDDTAADAEIVKEQAIAAMRGYLSNKGLEEYASIDSSVDGVVFMRLVFPSVTDYYIATGYTGREENEALTPAETKGLLDRYDFEKDSYLSESNVEAVRLLVAEEYRDFPLEGDYYYTYGTLSKMTTSNGEIKERDGVYYHTWQVGYEEKGQIKISNYALNGVRLVSLIISLFVLSLIILFVIIFIIEKRRKASFVDPPSADDAEPDPTSRTEETR